MTEHLCKTEKGQELALVTIFEIEIITKNYLLSLCHCAEFYFPSSSVSEDIEYRIRYEQLQNHSFQMWTLFFLIISQMF